jgi:hypothetical protein
VKTPVDARLCVEAQGFHLRFACEDCAHFDAKREACADGYPTGPHRRAGLALGREIVFCKEFELGEDGG